MPEGTLVSYRLVKHFQFISWRKADPECLHDPSKDPLMVNGGHLLGLASRLPDGAVRKTSRETSRHKGYFGFSCFLKTYLLDVWILGTWFFFPLSLPFFSIFFFFLIRTAANSNLNSLEVVSIVNPLSQFNSQAIFGVRRGFQRLLYISGVKQYIGDPKNK